MEASYEALSTSKDAAKGNGFGEKSIGMAGGIMLLINSIAGPTVVLMPALAQQAGWVSVVVASGVVAALYGVCGWMLLAAIRLMPGNANFERRVEYTDLINYYFSRWVSLAVGALYYVYLLMTLMTYIIQTTQVIDYLAMDAFGCAYGFELLPRPGFRCGVERHSITPFGDEIMAISLAFVVGAAICVPFGMLNLDDNIFLQWIAILGFSAIVVVWLVLLVGQAHFPGTLPAVTFHQAGLWGTLLFNFALAATLPSWANEKEKGVPVISSLFVSMLYVVVVYAVIAIVGGLAFADYYQTSETLFSKLNDMGSKLGQATVGLYPVLQNFTSIPVFSILMRYNLLRTRLVPGRWATVLAVFFPWLVSVPFYTSRGFARIAEVGGMCISPLINLAIPLLAYSTAVRSKGKRAAGAVDEEDALCS